MPNSTTILSHGRGIALSTAMAALALVDPGPYAYMTFVGAASAETSAAETTGGLAAISRDDLSRAEIQVAPALETGHHILLVAADGANLQVFDSTHPVGGPVVQVLELLGFELILPQGVNLDTAGSAFLSMDRLAKAQVEHVLLLPLTAADEQLDAIEPQLQEMVEGRLYRLEADGSAPGAQRWVAKHILPQVAAAIAKGAG